ncbi:response regulator [Bacillus sp. Marseille-P3661]|uniref:response regulator n=1 Tax=Bacillus sp. Marseille-P3661 TaxID=1936234 RepID=UPI000C83A487|nr:response regulator [Bacillus sp. Marseille-P3661]
MKIKTKVTIVLSLLPVLILFLIGNSWFRVTNLNKTNVIIQTNYDLVYLAEQIHRGIKDEAISLRNIVLLTDENLIEEELKVLQEVSKQVAENAARLESKAESTEQLYMINDFLSTNEKFNEYKANLVQLIKAGKRQEAIELMNNEARIIHEEFFQKASVIMSTYETEMDSSLNTFSDDFREDILFSSLISLIIMLIAIMIISRSFYTFSNRLNKVSNVMTDVADGNTDIGSKIEITSHDEIGDVVESFNKMAHSLEEQMRKEQSLIWVKSNIAEITTSLSGKHNLEVLAQTFLSKVVPLMGAAHAVFYVKDNESPKEPTFKLLASYAFKERKHLSNTFELGEGLIGQAAFEKTPIILTNVPSEYISVKSGLGEAAPLNVYVVPISFEDDVKAVVEIASFHSFSADQQTLLEELINSLGIIFDSAMGRIRLAKLLEEAQALTEEVQAQSEELQSQQEELRMANEELEEQTQALRASEEKLQVQQEELEQTNADLKEKAERLEEQNKKFELTNREVEKARDELEEKARQLALSSKYKSEFLANMSHELRTPLNSLLILSKLLADNKERNLTKKQIEYSKTIYSSGSDLLTLINDILDLAKIESGKTEVNPGKVQIKDLLDFVESNFSPVANEKNLNFEIVAKEGIPTSIYSDELRVKQVLKNLLSNAFKFTHQGGVKFEIDYSTKLNNQPCFSFSIEDTGIGVPEEKLDLIFQAFQQADGTTSRKYGGTGLGLSICRETAALLGGEVNVKSKVGKGSTFTFYVGDYKTKSNSENKEFNLDEVAVTAETKMSEQKERDRVLPSRTQHQADEIKRLLIVDDDVRQRNSIMELIGENNVIIKAVSSGHEAIEELKVNQFDCLVLDLGLADTTGFDLLKKIKTTIEDENIKVFIYTGRDLSSKEELFLNRYSHTIIIKDAHAPQRLKEELEFYLNSNDGNAEIEEVEITDINVAPELEGKKILLVDDDVRNVYALSSVLELYGMDITFAENGVEALKIVDETSDFDLILMDIMMPEMDGYETIRRLRDNPTFFNLPIIALTAKAMKEDREKCLEVGASDYIVKPVDPDQLISLIRVWLYA